MIDIWRLANIKTYYRLAIFADLPFRYGVDSSGLSLAYPCPYDPGGPSGKQQDLLTGLPKDHPVDDQRFLQLMHPLFKINSARWFYSNDLQNSFTLSDALNFKGCP